MATDQNPLPFTQQPAEPQLKDVLDALKKDILLSINCHHIGTVESFDSELQTAQATINYQKTYYVLNPVTGLYSPQLVSYPVLIDCPVIVLGGGEAALTFPIQKGDECLVLFNDRDIDNWFAGGTGTGNATPRLHSFADAILLVGLRSLNNVLDDYDSVRAVLRNGSTMVGVGPELVKIANATYDLGPLLQTLITQIKSLVTLTAAITVTGVTTGSGASGVPANAAAISAVSTELSTTASQLSELLE